MWGVEGMKIWYSYALQRSWSRFIPAANLCQGLGLVFWSCPFEPETSFIQESMLRFCWRALVPWSLDSCDAGNLCHMQLRHTLRNGFQGPIMDNAMFWYMLQPLEY